MNRQIEFITFPYSRAKPFNLFLNKKKMWNVSSAGLFQTRNMIQGICHYQQATLKKKLSAYRPYLYFELSR